MLTTSPVVREYAPTHGTVLSIFISSLSLSFFLSFFLSYLREDGWPAEPPLCECGGVSIKNALHPAHVGITGVAVEGEAVVHLVVITPPPAAKTHTHTHIIR